MQGSLPHVHLISQEKIQKVISLNSCVGIAICFHGWISRDDLFETRPHLYMFRQFSFLKSNSSVYGNNFVQRVADFILLRQSVKYYFRRNLLHERRNYHTIYRKATHRIRTCNLHGTEKQLGDLKTAT